MKVLFSIGISLLLLGCQAQEQEQANSNETSQTNTEQKQQNPFANLNVDQAKQLIDKGDVVVLDVRTDREYQAGHIEGAEHLDFYGQDFASKLEDLPKDKNYVVYCASGNRSGQAVAMMKKMNFEEAHNMLGGIGAWSSKYNTVR